LNLVTTIGSLGTAREMDRTARLRASIERSKVAQPAAASPKGFAEVMATVAPRMPESARRADAGGETKALLNLYHQAQTVSMPDTPESWVTAPPPATGSDVPGSAARTAAEINARSAYSQVGEADGKPKPIRERRG
jgi:hypothetical protein